MEINWDIGLAYFRNNKSNNVLTPITNRIAAIEIQVVEYLGMSVPPKRTLTWTDSLIPIILPLD